MRVSFAATLLVTTALAIEPIHHMEEKAEEKVEALAGKALDYAFATFCARFGKVYDTLTDYEKRKELFRKADLEVRIHHHKAYKKWKKAHNWFSDLTDAEKDAYRGYKPRPGVNTRKDDLTDVKAVTDFVESGDPSALQGPNMYKGGNGTIKDFSTSGLPDSLDWRDKGAV